MFNAGGYLFIYWQMHSAFKAQGLRKIAMEWSDSELTEIRIRGNYTNHGEYLRFIKPHEISINGHLFDIVRRKSEDQYTVLYCISDDEENALEAAFVKNIESSSNDVKGNPLSNLLSQLISFGFITENFSLIVFFSPGQYENAPPLYHVQPLKDVANPPPKNIS